MATVKEKSRGRVKNFERRRHRFGAHLSIAGGMHKAIAAALRMRCQTVQVFVKNQRQWRATPFDPDDLERWHTLAATPGFGPPIAHATYLINLASPNRALQARSRTAFAEELQRCQTLKIPYLVIHSGSATDANIDRGLARVAKALNRIFDRQPNLQTVPLLETTAGQGTGLGRSFEELGEILRRIEEPRRVGICIDTCHVFAAGYDIRQPAEYRALIELAEREVGLAQIRCWHLNDSKGECGSHLDRHEHIGRGHIGVAGFRNLLSDPRFLDVPMILETPKGTDAAGRDWDRVNLRRLRTIATQARKNGGWHGRVGREYHG
ncbi:MAG: deoxyribonuclease IV [Phycisphaerae bacterium]|nr:deoxyribonuclease IV [Phycisphaerae bacterium]